MQGCRDLGTKDAGMQGCRYARMQGCRDAGMQVRKDAGMQGCRDAGCRDAGPRVSLGVDPPRNNTNDGNEGAIVNWTNSFQ